VYFVLALLVLAGESYNSVLAVPVLFHTSLRIQLPNVVEFASGALFVAAPSLIGAVIMECCNLIPAGAGLFPPMSKPVRIGLGLVSGVLLILATALSGFFYLYRAAFIIDPEGSQWMSLFILPALGVCIAAVSIVAFWALVIGACGIASVVLWIVGRVCRVISAIASLAPSLLDVLAVHLSQGVLSVHGEFIGHDEYRVPPLFVDPQEGSRLPENASFQADAAIIVEADPDESSLEEITVTNSSKNLTQVLVGSFGTKMAVPLSNRIGRFSASGNILASCQVDLDSASRQDRIRGVADLSPTQTHIEHALRSGEGRENAYASLLREMPERLVEKYLHLRSVPSPINYYVDSPLLGCMCGPLSLTKRRLSLVSQFVATSISAAQINNPDVQEGLRAMQKLQDDGDIATTLILDPQSPLSTLHSENFQLLLLSHALIGLTVAHKQNPLYPSLPNLLRDLHSAGPFIGVSMVSQAVARGKVPSRYWWPWPGKNEKGSGDLGDVVIQARFAIEQALSETGARAYGSGSKTITPSLVFLSVPYQLNDECVPRLRDEISLYMAQNYNSTMCVVVCGSNGIAYPHQHFGSGYFVSACAFYPLPDLLLPSAAEKRKAGIVTPLRPFEPNVEATNGHGLLNSSGSVQHDSHAKTEKSETTPRATRRKETSK